jgi:integrase
MHAWQAFLDQSNRPDSGESTLRQYECQYEAFARWHKETHPQADKDDKPIRWELRHVTQPDADKYASHLGKKVSPSTFNRHVVLLSLVWRVLEKAARLSANPWKGIERKRFTVHSRRELTVDELGRVFNMAQGEMRLLLALGAFCGLRMGDAACLQWSGVDLARGLISLVPMKTARRSQKRITMPIHRTLLAMLEQIPPRQRTGNVLPGMAEAYSARRDAVCAAVTELFLSAEIRTNANAKTKSERDAEAAAKTEGDVKARPKPKHKVGRVSADCGFHSLRHTFVSLCAAGGVPQSVVQSLVGHGSPAMTAHYTHIGLAAAQSAVALLPDLTHRDAGEEAEASARARLMTALDIIEGLPLEGLKKVSAKVADTIEKRRKENQVSGAAGAVAGRDTETERGGDQVEADRHP